MASYIRRLHLYLLHRGVYELVRYLPRVLHKKPAILNLDIYHRMDRSCVNILFVCYICRGGSNA